VGRPRDGDGDANRQARDEHGCLLSVEMRAALGPSVEPAGTVHVERLNRALRDRLNALTRNITPYSSLHRLVNLCHRVRFILTVGAKVTYLQRLEVR
jgi:hypothetical protein